MIVQSDENGDDPRAGAAAASSASGAGGPAPGAAPQKSDEQLLDEYCQGNAAGFGELVRRYQRDLFHFLLRLLRDRAAAEDVFQETFLQVHRAAAWFEPSRRFRPWLFTIAANKAKDRLRIRARWPALSLDSARGWSASRTATMPAGPQAPGAELEREELQEQVDLVLATMPDGQREILLLSYFHGFPRKQIAEILDMPLRRVKFRLHSAVVAFATRWRDVEKRPAAPGLG